jgi:hypothetical protein
MKDVVVWVVAPLGFDRIDVSEKIVSSVFRLRKSAI